MSIERILARQAGVLSRAQATSAGLSPATVDALVRARVWRPLHPRVYTARPQPGAEAHVWAAMLWAGAGAVLCGRAAAWWHGLLGEPPAVVTITVPGRSRARPGVRLRSGSPPDRVEVAGLAVTALPATVLDAALELGDRAGTALLTAGHVPLPLLRAACARRAGHPGAAGAERLLRAAVQRPHPAAARSAQAPGVCRVTRELAHPMGGQPPRGSDRSPRPGRYAQVNATRTVRQFTMAAEKSRASTGYREL